MSYALLVFLGALAFIDEEEAKSLPATPGVFTLETVWFRAPRSCSAY